MNSKLSWISRVITGILSYFLASASAGKLLLFGNVFDENFHSAVFKHMFIICSVLLLTYIIIEIIIYLRNIDKKQRIQCQNICRYVYKYIEDHVGEDFVHASRITIFKAMRPNTEKVYLKAVSRYQTKEPYKKAKIKFLPGEGVAGRCFEIQALILANLPEYSERNHMLYYKESYDKYKLASCKVDKLNTRSCLFLGIPIKIFDTGKTWGVLVLDSTMQDDRLNETFARGVEEIIRHYTVFFTEGGK